MSTPASGRRLTVAMYVYNDATMDSRVRREAATLAAAGHSVTVLATNRAGVTEIERERVEGYEIVRVPVPASWQRHWPSVMKPGVGRAGALVAARAGFRRGPTSWPGAVRSVAAALGWLGLSLVRRIALALPRRLGGPGTWPPPQLRWLVNWRWSTLRWADAAVAAAPSAAIHHGHDLTGLPAALRGARRDAGQAVYDSHEIFVDSGQNAERPRWARALLRRLERRWGGQVAGLVSVNPAYAEVIARRIKPPRVAVVHNCPPTWTPDAEAATRLRDRAGIPAGAPIVLYHGAFSRQRGLAELAAAMLEPGLRSAHLVYLGYGGERVELERLASDDAFGGRIHVVGAVSPDELLGFVAGADVDAIPLQPTTLNHWLCTPNKLFESLAAGVPVVVSDFPVMRGIVMDDPSGALGAVCDPTSPAAIASAITAILARSPAEREALRAGCRAAAAERWNWETESQELLRLYADLSRPAGLGQDADR